MTHVGVEPGIVACFPKKRERQRQVTRPKPLGLPCYLSIVLGVRKQWFIKHRSGVRYPQALIVSQNGYASWWREAL